MPPTGAKPGKKHSGVIAWMATNGVAANVMMVVLIAGGLVYSTKIKREVFPEFEMDVVTISVAYPGASPDEVENGVTLVLEEALRGIDGAKRVTSYSRENVAVAFVELLVGANQDRALSDVESAIARITSFPKEIEQPEIALFRNRIRVLSLVVYGDHSRADIRKFAELTRAELLADKRVTNVELTAVSPLEISIDVPRSKLRQYALTLDAIAARVRQASIEMPAGGVKTPGGEVLLRTAERRNTGQEFADIVLFAAPGGGQVKVSDVATVRDGFEETDQEAFFNGKPAAIVDVYRVGAETPITVSQAVKDFIENRESNLPAGMHYAIWTDTSELYASRMDLLTRNAVIGLILVLVILGLFLEVKLAFWVTMGIPISFIGALLFMPMTGVSINMISLFAFIVVLGMVVDDAIVVGEAVYKRRMDGAGRLEAAIGGAREVAMPVCFAIITTMIAFSPMLFVPGATGKFFRVIPIVVIIVLALSLFESLLILPAHLAHSRRTADRGVFGFIHRRQQRFSRMIEWLIDRSYVPLLRGAVRRRYLTFCVALAIFIGTIGVIVGGRLEQTFLPKIEQDNITAQVRLQFGASIEDTKVATRVVLDAAYRTFERFDGEQSMSRGVFSQVGNQSMAQLGSPGGGFGRAGGHLGEVAISLVPWEQRSVTSGQFVREWRRQVGDLVNVESIKFVFATGAGSGPTLDFELSHRDVHVIEAAAMDLARRLAKFEGVRDIEDGFDTGKEQLDFRMKPEGLSRGLTAADVGRQVRAAFYGAEVLRQQRGRDELKVFVRLPRDERRSEYDLEQLLLRTSDGGEIPLGQAATVVRSRSYTSVSRVDGRRVVNVQADVDEGVANGEKITGEVLAGVLPEVAVEYPGLKFRVGGEQRQRREAMEGLLSGFGIALICMIALLAVAFRSYIQWLVVMIVIPFGFVGAVIGHIVMGYDLSMMSFMGFVALSGVVINDSLILIVAVNDYRKQGHSAFDAIILGGQRRFRPILLTSLTTFFGLMPIILETSQQARFLIPMAVSLGFGIMFATFIMLLLVPAVYMIVEDAKRGGLRLYLSVLRLLGYRTPVWLQPSDRELEDDRPAGELGGEGSLVGLEERVTGRTE